VKRVLFYCQHVLGMGHLVRSIEFVRGLNDFDVCFLNGGELVSGINVPANVRLVNLPVLKSDEDFHDIHAPLGQSIEEVKERRRSRILEVVGEFRPDVAVIELFPFGRRKFAFELIPMLEKIRSHLPATKVVCSLRDILVSKQDREGYESKVRTVVDSYFDLLLVHSDPVLQRLEESFASLQQIRCPIEYTGFIVRQPHGGRVAPQNGRIPRIVASIGGGCVGRELLDAAIGASAELGQTLAHKMEIFAGPFLPDADFSQLSSMADRNPSVTISRFTPSLSLRLLQADLSISMAGYNTCMDVIVTGVPALLYPFTGGDNEEQTTRARKLQGLRAATVLDSQDLQPKKLTEKILSQLTRRAPRVTLDLDGVHKTAALLRNLTYKQ
jgi:predicted glycosyltransferase